MDRFEEKFKKLIEEIHTKLQRGETASRDDLLNLKDATEDYGNSLWSGSDCEGNALDWYSSSFDC